MLFLTRVVRTSREAGIPGALQVGQLLLCPQKVLSNSPARYSYVLDAMV